MNLFGDCQLADIDILNDFWLVISDISFHAFESLKVFGNFLIKIKTKDDRAEHFLHHRQTQIPYQCQFCTYELESQAAHNQPPGYDETD